MKKWKPHCCYPMKNVPTFKYAHTFDPVSCLNECKYFFICAWTFNDSQTFSSAAGQFLQVKFWMNELPIMTSLLSPPSRCNAVIYLGRKISFPLACYFDVYHFRMNVILLLKVEKENSQTFVINDEASDNNGLLFSSATSNFASWPQASPIKF